MLNQFWKCLFLILFAVVTGCNDASDVTSESSNSEGASETTEVESQDTSQMDIPEGDPEPVEEEAEPAEEESLDPADVKLSQASWEEIMKAAKSHPGKVVVLDIWSTSCQPCLREFPNLVEISQKYPERVVCLSCSTDFIGISSKPPEYYEKQVRKFLSAQNAKFDNYLCTEAADEIFLKIDLASIPAVYLFGPEGELVERFDNDEQKYGDEFTYQDHILPKLKSLLESAE